MAIIATIILYTTFSFMHSITAASTVSCLDFNKLGVAKNSDEFTTTIFTNQQASEFLKIFSEYLSDIKDEKFDEDSKEALLVLNNAEQIEYVTANTLSMTRHSCLLHENKNLKAVVIDEFRSTFVDGYKRQRTKIRDALKEINDSMPVEVDKATVAMRMTLKKNATIEVYNKMKNVSSQNVNRSGLPDFIAGLQQQITEDVCNGKTYQTDMKGFTVLYNYYYNDGKLLKSYNLREIKLANCPSTE